MKTFAATLLAFLQTNTAYSRADLFAITLPNGFAIRATSWQLPVTVPSGPAAGTYQPSQYGSWARGKITSEATFDLHGNDMPLTLICPPSVLFPIPPNGQLSSFTPMMQAIAAGLFDAALVQIWTAYGPPGQIMPTIGLETKFAGYIMPNGEMRRDKVEFEVADPLFILNQKIPRNVLQAGCMWTLFDVNEFAIYGTRTGCALSPAGFSENNSVAASSTRQSVNLGTTASHAAPYYTQGFLTMTSGQNNGMSFQIKQQVSTSNILLANVMPLPLAIGDTFTMFAGCDKTAATCNSKFSNLVHLKATPFVPNPEVAI
jgi:uncharacterized phage protein (TIGR02218 family)